ncbi:Hypothetical predicted protein [Paramuricea clavata]|uniref:Uncharacterized protein n=1 Tax=Paramuricea clavata TaxID=317549 RepID=A0A7D9DN92_PARCT|nr:Hypothetical predicted protein [Paramuricea clavata]
MSTQVCGVLPRRRYTAISVINGAIDSSAVMLLIFKLCYNSGISFKTIIIVYYSFIFGHGLLFTFSIFPKDLTDSTNTDIGNGGSNEEHSISSKADSNDLDIHTVGQLENENVFTISGEGKISLLSIIKGPKFMIHTCFVSITTLRSFFFIGIINKSLKRLTNDEEKVDFYLTILGLIQFTGIVLAFVPGFLLDWSPAGRHRNFSIIISFVLTGLISILVTVGLLIPVLELQIFNFFLYTILSSFLFSTHGSFIMKEFPLYHAGALFGLSLLVSAVVSLFQIPMFALMDGPYNGDPIWINVGLLVVQILVMVHPVYLWHCSKDEKKCSNNL